jgi:hypothetical protein
MTGQGMKMQPVKRSDGKYEEKLEDNCLVEYFEEPQTGLWRVEVFLHDVSEWTSTDFSSLEEAREAAQNYFDQL